MSSAFFSPFDSFMFTAVPIIVVIGFILVFGLIAVRLVQGGMQWRRNNESPQLTTDAVIVSKRADVSHFHHAGTGTNHMHHSSSSTTYFVTFEVPSGSRMEFAVRDTEYGMLAEGDRGRLTFQGTRYQGFERIRA